jgi:hypothetical protein
MRRRAFLRRSAAWLLAGSSLGVGAIAEACTRTSFLPSPTAKSSGTSASALTPSPSPVPRVSWDGLAAQLEGQLIRPGTAAYPNAKLDYNPRFDTIHPRAIVMAESPQDVARTIAFARERGMAFAARSGGHSYARLFAEQRDRHRRFADGCGASRFRDCDDRRRSQADRRCCGPRPCRRGRPRRHLRDRRDRRSHHGREDRV